MTGQAHAWLALGANLPGPAGGPREALEAALRALAEEPGTRVVSRSRVYRTAPVGGVAQDDFANAACAVATRLDPLALLEACRRLEDRFGRRRGERWGPRTLDVDLLIYDTEVRDDPRLTLPHPRLHERRFVLVPLAEIAPGLVHPRLGATIRELLHRCPDRARVEPWPDEAVAAGSRS